MREEDLFLLVVKVSQYFSHLSLSLFIFYIFFNFANTRSQNINGGEKQKIKPGSYPTESSVTCESKIEN